MLEIESDMLEMVKIDKEDMVFLFYMLGMIGNLKGVVYIYVWVYVYLCMSVLNWFGIEENDIVWVIVSLGW